MEEGVATESRGGTGAEVTGVGWSLPCSLSSLLAMNCRARAEGLARRLQSRVRIGGGRNSAVEHTSLVTPGPEDHYASMECRHSSFDDQQMDLLDECKLRPIHVVTSEPTLHLCLPSPPSLGNVQEQDSDVYYDFDLASPDEAPEGEEEEEDQQQENEHQIRQYEATERPESGCVTSVTSPVMFDDSRDEDEGEESHSGQGGDLFPPEESILCFPDADLRAVRQILSNSSLNDVSNLTTESGDGKGNCDQNQKCVECNENKHERCEASGCNFSCACECSNRHLGTHGTLAQVRGSGLSSGTVSSTEGAGEAVHSSTSRSMLVTSPVAKSGSYQCHTALGTLPAVPHTSPDSKTSATSLTDCAGSDNTYPDRDHESSEACRVENCVMIDNEGQNKGGEGHENTREWGEVDGQGTGFVARVTVRYSPFEDDFVTREDHDKPEVVPRRDEGIILKTFPETATVPRAISGATPPLTDPHLYTPSEGQPTVMEAREDEADLQLKGEVFHMDFDTEEIETLAEDEDGSEDEEENEEDIEEETILTGKFRNIRGYTERVRRLSDEAEDRTPPVTVICYDEEGFTQSQEPTKEEEEEVTEEQVCSAELASQLSELQVEDVGIQVEADDTDVSVDDAANRSSSEETDPERVEDYKMRIKRSSSLKCGKTPPGTPGRKKIVRFADVLGLDLAAVRTFLGGGVPHVPRSAFWDLQVENEAAVAATTLSYHPPNTLVPRRVLTPLFQQPGSQLNFLERVRNQRVVVESVDVGDDMSVRGIVRVLNLDYNKSVCVRYTFDHWRNFHEATATYVPGSYDGLTDRFSFLLWGSFLQDNGALAFCVRYQTLGQEFWDNNHDRNYTLQCYTSTGIHGDTGPNGSPRPQNSSSVQQHYNGGGISGTRSAHYNCFLGSPTTPNDPWITTFF
ncbi:glycogen-binding subunit 76A-like isoform X2 [Homarus americanus]|nr:glycogen-binding subunit 76A-like isoform X2 [Homarus americanus]